MKIDIQNLKNVLHSKKLTQGSLALYLGVKQPTVAYKLAHNSFTDDELGIIKFRFGEGAVKPLVAEVKTKTKTFYKIKNTYEQPSTDLVNFIKGKADLTACYETVNTTEEIMTMDNNLIIITKRLVDGHILTLRVFDAA